MFPIAAAAAAGRWGRDRLGREAPAARPPGTEHPWSRLSHFVRPSVCQTGPGGQRGRVVRDAERRPGDSDGPATRVDAAAAAGSVRVCSPGAGRAVGPSWAGRMAGGKTETEETAPPAITAWSSTPGRRRGPPRRRVQRVWASRPPARPGIRVTASRARWQFTQVELEFSRSESSPWPVPSQLSDLNFQVAQAGWPNHPRLRARQLFFSGLNLPWESVTPISELELEACQCGCGRRGGSAGPRLCTPPGMAALAAGSARTRATGPGRRPAAAAASVHLTRLSPSPAPATARRRRRLRVSQWLNSESSSSCSDFESRPARLTCGRRSNPGRRPGRGAGGLGLGSVHDHDGPGTVPATQSRVVTCQCQPGPARL